MRKYETIYLLKPDLDGEALKGLVEKFKSLVEKNGELTNIDEWGKRKLAYPIKKYNEAYYVLMNFRSNPEFPHELERIYKITDEVIRYIIVKEEE